MLKNSLIFSAIGILMISMLSCGAGKSNSDAGDEDSAQIESISSVGQQSLFSSDSAYKYLKRQVEFGPRVPNSEAHRLASAWLISELKRHGAEVHTQQAALKGFDGTTLNSVNIFGQFNPGASRRILLLAHYDTRPWADQDPDPANHDKPLDGANDGASGVAVLLEAARILGSEQSPIAEKSDLGVDILFVDAEDYGQDGDEESWALGTNYFVNNPIINDYKPEYAVLLDMVGGKGATFPAEYFSRQSAPQVDDRFRAAAAKEGYANMFPLASGSAVTDDHVQLIRAGIPAIDIIDYRSGTGFPPTWHTLQDNLENIDPATLQGVGATLIRFLEGN